MKTFPQECLQQSPLSIRNVSKRYDDQTVVDDLSFEMRPGEILGLLGPNGAGKSTTINMIAGVTPLSSGTVGVFGYDNRRQYFETRRLIGVMHQDPVIEQYLSIGKSLEIHSGYYGVADDPQWREILIEHLNLGPHLEKRYIKLSGGMRRRFMIAKTLLHKPRLVILDEPTAGVDVELRSRLWEFVRAINQSGISVLLTTHYLNEAEQMCDRIAFLNEGRLVALEETRKLIDKIGDQKLSLRFGEDLETVPGPLRHFNGASLDRENRRVRFVLKNGREIAEVLKVATRLDLTVDEVDVAHPDLEDVFRRLMDQNHER